MEEFFRKINQTTLLSDNEALEIRKISNTKNHKKGDIILKLNQINRKLYFISSGILKVSFLSEGKEFIMKFFSAHEFCAVLDSLTTNKPSNYTIVALTDVILIEVDFFEFKKQSLQNPAFEKITASITSLATRKMMQRIRELLETDARQRYLNFLENNNHLMSIISLKDLSAYLGISQVSLSRIRAKI